MSGIAYHGDHNYSKQGTWGASEITKLVNNSLHNFSVVAHGLFSDTCDASKPT